MNSYTGPDASDALPVVNRPYRFWSGLTYDVSAGVAQRELLRAFVARELRQRYKGSILGWGWALIRPLVMLLVYGIAVGLFLGAGKTIPQFAVYLYTGLIAWGFFSSIVTGAIAVLPGNSGLINKAAFQRELLIVSVVAVALFDLVIQGSVLIVGYLAYGAWPPLSSLWWVILGVVVLLVVGTAFGLVLSAANVYFRDVGYLTEVGLQVAFWMIPIIYSYQMVVNALGSHDVLVDLYSANPLVSAVNAFRVGLWPAADSVVGAEQLMPNSVTAFLLVVSLGIGVVFLWLGQRYFAKASGNMAQEL